MLILILGWVWTDGSGTNYKNWDDGQPDDKGGTWNCVEMSQSDGTWAVTDCYSNRNWLCKIRRGNIIFCNMQIF